MSAPPRNLPRFLPTLTEVVQPSGLSRALAPPTPDPEEIVQLVMLRVGLATDRRICEETEALVRALVTEQTKGLGERLRQELESRVRQAVTDALTPCVDKHKIN